MNELRYDTLPNWRIIIFEFEFEFDNVHYPVDWTDL